MHSVPYTKTTNHNTVRSHLTWEICYFLFTSLLACCWPVISSWSQVEHLQAVSLDSQISANKWTVIMLMGSTELRRIRQQDLDFTDKLCCFLGRGVNFFLEYVICHIKYGSGIRGCPKLVSHFCSFQLIMHCEV